MLKIIKECEKNHKKIMNGTNRIYTFGTCEKSLKN